MVPQQCLLYLKGQLVTRGHTVGHIQLAKEEVEKYKIMPIIDYLEGGKSESRSQSYLISSPVNW